MRSMPILKCSSERWVWAPQSRSAGTWTSPSESFSFLMLVLFKTFSFLNKFPPIVPASLQTETNRSIYMLYRLRFRLRCRPDAATVVATHPEDSSPRLPLLRRSLFPFGQIPHARPNTSLSPYGPQSLLHYPH